MAGAAPLEALFVALVAIGLPVRAWRRGRRGAPPAPAIRYSVETLTLTACLAALLARRGIPADALGLRPASFLIFLRDLIVCLTVIVGMDAWSVWRLTRRARLQPAPMAARMPPEMPPEAPVQAGVFADTLSARRTLATFAVTASVGAIWEELCFRAAFFLFVPRTAIGLPIGIAIGCALFGAQHLRNGAAGFAYSSWFGLLFSLLYLATGDLIAVTIAHAAGNILAVAQWAPRIAQSRRPSTPPAPPGEAPIFFG